MAAEPTADGSPPVLPRREPATPRSAAIAGILFAVLLGTSLLLLRLSVPARPQGAGLWLSDPPRRHSVRWALNLAPFAGIAFLCFIGVVRDRMGPLKTAPSRPWSHDATLAGRTLTRVGARVAPARMPCKGVILPG